MAGVKESFPRATSAKGITQLGPTKFRVRAYIGRREDGRAAYAQPIVNGLLRDAKEAQRELEARKATGQLVPRKVTRHTLGGWLTEYAEKYMGHLAPRTRASIAQHFRDYLPESFKAQPLSKITTETCDHWLNELVAMQTQDSRPLARSNVQRARAYLHTAFEVARKRAKIIARNPLTDAKLPDAPTAIERPAVHGETERKTRARPEDRPLSVKEAGALLLAVERRAEESAQREELRRDRRVDRLTALWRVWLETGLRPSEATGLRWRNVQLAYPEADAIGGEVVARSGPIGGTIVIREAITPMTTEPGWGWKSTKTADTRSIPISATAAQGLARLREVQATDREHSGEAYHDHDLVFSTAIGTPHDLTNLRRVLHDLCDMAGIPRRTAYDLRHTTASVLANAGEPVHFVAQRMGHGKSSAGTTMRYYVHAPDDAQRRCTETLAALLDSSLASARKSAMIDSASTAEADTVPLPGAADDGKVVSITRGRRAQPEKVHGSATA